MAGPRADTPSQLKRRVTWLGRLGVAVQLQLAIIVLASGLAIAQDTHRALAILKGLQESALHGALDLGAGVPVGPGGQELEIEVAQLRAWLQAAQAAAPQPLAAPAQEVVQEPVYAPAFPVIVVGGCSGRDCKPNRHPHHDGGDHHGNHDGNHNGDGRASVRTPRTNTPRG